MKINIKKYVFILTILITTFTIPLYANASAYQSFSYTFAWGASPCPDPYIPVSVIDNRTSGVNLNSPSDMCITEDGNIYVTSIGSNSLIVLSPDGVLLNEVTSMYDENLAEIKFNAPEGVFVDDEGTIYISDTQNARIVKLGDMGKKFIGIINLAQSDVLGVEYKFLPSKIVVDSANRIFVISKNDFQGILELAQNGNFVGYVGTNNVNPSAIDLFWRRVMTQAQRDRLRSFIPYEFSNISLDNQGFIYTVSSSSQEAKPIKRLNPSGQDVLIRQDYMRSTSNVSREGSFYIDVSASDDGSYSAIDYQTGRIYTYNYNGYLLYGFGRIGNRVGNFKRPVAIERKGDKLFVLDNETGNITVLEMTEYAKLISLAENNYNTGEYEKSIEVWKEVLKLNSNFELAYAQIGRVLHRQEKYDEAMEYFRLGNFRGDRATQMGGYNESFTRYRQSVLRDYLGIVFSGILILAAIFIVRAYYKKKKVNLAGRGAKK